MSPGSGIHGTTTEPVISTARSWSLSPNPHQPSRDAPSLSSLLRKTFATASPDKAFLKALSLFLSSDFMFYHQFLTSSQFGVKRDVATLSALRRMPIGIGRSEEHTSELQS